MATIFELKELASTFQTLLLAEFTFVDGSIYRASTHPLSVQQGGFPYGGLDWDGRILNQDVGSAGAMSDLGVDIPPNVTVVLADPGKEIFNGWEQEIGFKGAILRLYVVMWDAGGTTAFFSGDDPAPIKFIGTCGPANADQGTISITAVSLLNFTQKQMPPIRIQQICAYNFPPDEQSRSAALTDPLSIFYQCGYSFGISGGCGNAESGSAAFTSCPLSFDACIARLGNPSATTSATTIPPIMRDIAGNDTGRFGGFHWIPPQDSGRQRPYVTGRWEDILNVSNDTKYGDYLRLCYGTTWVTPTVMGVWGDGNYTNLEVAICFGKINKIHKVLVNGVETMQYYLDTIGGYQPPDNSIPSDAIAYEFKNGYWRTINDGRRNGVPNGNDGWARQGDPYGSVAAIHIKVLRQIAPENAIPQVQVLVDGVDVEVYTDVDTHSGVFSNNPVWILRDILIDAGWRDQNLDVQSFIDVAALCDVVVNFDSMSGAYQNYYNESGAPPFRRFSIGFAVQQRMAFGDLVRGLRAATRAMLYFNFNTGKLTLLMKQTLGDQQPSSVPGSNNSTPFTSVSHDGSVNSGYSAYSFDQSNIVKDTGGRSTLTISQRQLSDAPNKTTLQFLNRESQYSQDSISIVDVEDVGRVQQELTISLPVIGVQTFDHARRILNNWLAENYRGNGRLDYVGSAIGDTGGTTVFQFTTTVKGIHLVVGQIIDITDVQYGIVQQLARIIRVKPSTNYETVQITAQWHNDNWYQDTFGQAEQPIYGPAQGLGKVPYSWRPGLAEPMTDDSFYGPSDLGFDIYPIYSLAADNTGLCSLQIVGKVPVNSFPSGLHKPRLELLGIGTTGGSEPTGSFYVALCEREDESPSGHLSATSKPALVKVVAPDDAIEFVANAWPGHPSGYIAFAGLHPTAMSFQSEGSGTPEIVDLLGPYNEASWGPPDDTFSHHQFNVRLLNVPGPFGNVLPFTFTPPLVTPNSMQISTYQNYPLVIDRWAGRDLSVYALAARSSIAGTSGVGTISVQSPGSSYAVGDTGQILGPTSGGIPATYVVDSIDGSGGVVGITVTDPGSGYKYLVPANTAVGGSQPGIGSGLWVNISTFSDSSLNVVTDFSTPIPIANFRISGNNENTLFFSSGDPTTCVNGGSLMSGDVIVMRSLLNFGSDEVGNYFEDPIAGDYELMPLYLHTNVGDVTNTTPIHVVVDRSDGSGTQFFEGDSIVIEGVLGTTSANGHFIVVNASADGAEFDLQGSSGNGEYEGGGVVAKQLPAGPDVFAGELAFIVSGTGRGTSIRVKGNTATKIYIDGDWPVQPDETSRIVIVSGTYIVTQPGVPINNAIREFVIKQGIEVKNYDKIGLLVQVAAVSKYGANSLVTLDPFRELYLVGNPGISSTDLPGSPQFKVKLEEYAMLTISDFQVPANANAIKEANFLAPSVDETDIGLWAMGTIDDSSTTFTPIQVSNKSRYGTKFQVNDFVIWDVDDDLPKNYEIDQIQAIASDGTMTLKRQNPLARAGYAFFGSKIDSHSLARIYRLEPKMFAGAIRQNTYGAVDTPSGLPQHWSFAWPNRMVAAVVGQAIGDLGNSSIYVNNLGSKQLVENDVPNCPGLRTLSGAAYINISINSGLSAGQTADQRVQVQSWSSIRCIYASVDVAPVGADIIVHVCYITPDFKTVALMDTLRIAAGALVSYDPTSNLPSSRMMPYHSEGWARAQHWPPNELPVVGIFSGALSLPIVATDESPNNVIFAPDGFIDIIIEQAGTTTPGTNLKVNVQV